MHAHMHMNTPILRKKKLYANYMNPLLIGVIRVPCCVEGHFILLSTVLSPRKLTQQSQIPTGVSLAFSIHPAGTQVEPGPPP